MKLKILAIAVCIICSVNLIGQDQFDRLYRTNQRVMTSLDMVEQEGGGTYFLLSKYFAELDTLHGLNVTSLDKKGSVNWSRDYIFYEDSSAIETVGSIVITREGLMINAVVVDTLAELSNVMVGLGPTGLMQYARSYGSNSEDSLVVGNAILSNALDPMEVFHFGNSMTADGIGLYASKLGLDGAVIWAADLHAKDTLDNSFDEEIVDIDINYDSTYLAVGSLDDNSFFILNHDEDGNQIYSRSYETFGDFQTKPSGIATFADSTTVVSAYITNNLGNTTGGLIKLDTLGNVEWSKQLTASLGLGTITINDVVEGSAGQIVIAGNIEAPDVTGAIEEGEFIMVLTSSGTVISEQQYQIIGGKGSLRSGALSLTDDNGFAYLTTAFDEMGGSDSLIMRMIKVDALGALGILKTGEDCHVPLEGLRINDLAYRQDTLVWEANLIENGVDTIEVFDFNYSHTAPILTLPDTVFCPGDPVMFEIDATTQGAVAYRWYKADDPDVTIGIDSVYIATELDVDYVAEVKVELDNCFTLCDTTRLSDIDPPMIAVGRSFGQLCVSNEVVLFVDGASGNRVEWSTGETTPQILVAEPGNYSVEVTNECDDSSEASISVSEEDFYQAGGGIVTVDLDNCANGVIPVFVETTGDVSSVVWNTGATGNVIAVTQAGTYSATIIDICGEQVNVSADVSASEIFGCSEGDCPEGSSEAENGCLCWPNAFIPASMDDANASFGPNNRCPSLTSYNLRIYNRWGEKVFESDNVNTEWNGRRGSSNSPSEVYAFYVVYEVEGVEVKDKGHVTLIR